MTSVRGLVPVVVVAALLALPGLARGATVQGLERSALAKLKKAPVDAPTKTAARAQIARAAHLVRTLPNGRGYHVLVALQEVASFPGAVTQPRALALYGALRANNDYFAAHWAPRDKTDIVGADGVVYRYFGGHCFRFHPLANFGVLNARANAGDVEGTELLADALIARGVYQQGGGIGWEYDFPFGGGQPPWLSGMAQAVAAQAFARAAQAVPERAPVYLREATAAFRTVPRRLLTSVAAGPWVRLYSFSTQPVLNAQLQSVVSLQSYAAATGDGQAATLAARMQNAAAATLPRFDTGYWSYYALPSDPSPPDYQQYVVQLLNRLKSADPRFAAAATRFAGYQTQPPAFQLANAGVGQVRFWLSKPATVVADTPAGPSKRLALLDGWHTLTWTPTRPGVYPVHLTATDWNGNRTQLDALPIVRIGRGAFSKVTPVNAGAQGTGPFVVANRALVTWPDGAAAPDPALVASLAALPTPVLLELDAVTTPTPAFTQYAVSLAQQLPSLRYLVVGPPPTAAAVPQYAATVAAVRGAVRAALPALAVGMTIDGAVTPKQVTAALARAAAAADVVTFRAAAATTGGQWTQPSVAQLAQAFGGALPPLLLDAPSAAALSAATCLTGIAGAALDPTAVDPATTAAVSTLIRGATVCPGVQAAATLSTVAFPTSVSSGTPAALQLACVRDCLYVATLVGSDGRPVVASRGALKGGSAPATVTLPKTQLGQASYTLDLRVVSTVNPGAVVELASPPLSRTG